VKVLLGEEDSEGFGLDRGGHVEEGHRRHHADLLGETLVWLHNLATDVQPGPVNHHPVQEDQEGGQQQGHMAWEKEGNAWDDEDFELWNRKLNCETPSLY